LTTNFLNLGGGLLDLSRVHMVLIVCGEARKACCKVLILFYNKGCNTIRKLLL
jgi:hypothetical protein